MADYRISATNVQYRLREWTSVEASDTVLNSPSFIPFAEAYVNLTLTNNGKSYATMSMDEQALVVAWELDLVAMQVICTPPGRRAKTTIAEINPVSAEDREIIVKRIQANIDRILRILGVRTIMPYSASSGGDDYMMDGEDLRNIDLSDESGEEISRWA